MEGLANFNALPPATLATFGYYPCTITIATFDPRIQAKRKSTWELVDGVALIAEQVTDRPLADVQAELIEQVKVDCGQRIVAVYQEYKQRNMIAKAVELSEKKADGSITVDETALFTNLKSAWSWVESVRLTSNAIEAQISGATTVQAVADVYDNAIWPEMEQT